MGVRNKYAIYASAFLRIRSIGKIPKCFHIFGLTKVTRAVELKNFSLSRNGKKMFNRDAAIAETVLECHYVI